MKVLLEIRRNRQKAFPHGNAFLKSVQSLVDESHSLSWEFNYGLSPGKKLSFFPDR